MILLFLLCIIVSIFSQIKPLEDIFRPLMYASWFFTFLYCILYAKLKLSLSKFTYYFIFVLIIFLLYCVFCSSIFGSFHLENNYLRLLYIPIMLSILGDIYSNFITEKQLQIIYITYVLMSIVFAIWVHNTFFSSLLNWRFSMEYVFAQKNSAAQIWGSAILINVFLIDYKNALLKHFGKCISFYLLFLILITHCRTALLGLMVAFFWDFLRYSKHKILLGIVLILLVQIISSVHFIQDTINHSLLITKYEGTSLDAFSSGRLGLYSIAWDFFITSPIIGVGAYYVDNSYLLILTESGIIGFVLIESIWLYKIIECYKSVYYDKFFHKKFSLSSRFLISILIFYIVESLLEGFPPFGPGVSSFMFWFITIILIKIDKKNRKVFVSRNKNICPL